MVLLLGEQNCLDVKVSRALVNLFRNNGVVVVLSLRDNYSGHGSEWFLPALGCTSVTFSVANTTARLQLRDTGIVDCVERRYGMGQYSSAFDALKDGSNYTFISLINCVQ